MNPDIVYYQVSDEMTLPADQAITGWRVWSVRRRYTPPLALWLHSFMGIYGEADGEWRPNRAPHARCRDSLHKPSPHKHADVPYTACGCGFSAYTELEVLLSQFGSLVQSHPMIIGQVSLWGKVVTSGPLIRASFAYPQALYVCRDWWTGDMDPPDIAAALDPYGVPARDVDSSELFEVANDSGPLSLAVCPSLNASVR